ncbi:hypothetical protein BU15DRAFT_59852 [Melanogaster broomeanus]|nr:hypothetical protein BU15DRAFT_59852 [Melanogaster broomeanus]
MSVRETICRADATYREVQSIKFYDVIGADWDSLGPAWTRMDLHGLIMMYCMISHPSEEKISSMKKKGDSDLYDASAWWARHSKWFALWLCSNLVNLRDNTTPVIPTYPTEVSHNRYLRHDNASIPTWFSSRRQKRGGPVLKPRAPNLKGRNKAAQHHSGLDHSCTRVPTYNVHGFRIAAGPRSREALRTGITTAGTRPSSMMHSFFSGTDILTRELEHHRPHVARHMGSWGVY